MNALDKIPASDIVVTGLVVTGIGIGSLDPVNPAPGDNYLWDDGTSMLWDNRTEVLAK